MTTGAETAWISVSRRNLDLSTKSNLPHTSRRTGLLERHEAYQGYVIGYWKQFPDTGIDLRCQQFTFPGFVRENLFRTRLVLRLELRDPTHKAEACPQRCIRDQKIT